jgi:hypothetical protein
MVAAKKGLLGCIIFDLWPARQVDGGVRLLVFGFKSRQRNGGVTKAIVSLKSK